MAELISEACLVSRKSHICGHCYCTIPKGTRYLRQFIKDGGGVWSWISHEDCQEAAVFLFYQDGGGHDEELIALHEYEEYSGEFPDHLRGRWPHVVCRLELRKQIAELAYLKRKKA